MGMVLRFLVAPDCSSQPVMSTGSLPEARMVTYSWSGSVADTPPYPLTVTSPRLGDASPKSRASELPRTLHCYAFKNDERAFAHALLSRRTQLWVFSAHQGAACGDFLVVDLSCADLARRVVYVLDLKQGRAVREGGVAGWQMRHAELGVAELAARGVVAREARHTVLTGDGEGLLEVFGAA